MSDDDLTSTHELASAYLDGELDPSARALVDDSPELLQQVAVFGQVRASLADVPPVSATTREAAVAAALAAFDAASGTLSTSNTASFSNTEPFSNTESLSNTVSLDSRRRWSRVLTAAAAVIVIGGAGIVAVNGMRHSSSRSSSGAPAADAGATVAIGGAATSTIGAINQPAFALPVLTDAQQLRTIADQPSLGGTTKTDTAGGAPSDATTVGASANSTAATTRPESTSGRGALRCPLGTHQVFVAEIVWKTTPAVVVRDTVTGVIQAIDDQCTVLAEATP